MSLEILIAWKYLGAQRKNIFVFLITLFSILGIGIGSFALVVALSAANGFEDEVTSKMIGKDSHFEVMRYHSAPLDSVEAVSEKILKNKEVIAISPYLVYKMGISSKYGNDGIVVYGIDAEKSSHVLDLHNNIKWGDYSLDSLRDASTALVNRNQEDSIANNSADTDDEWGIPSVPQRKVKLRPAILMGADLATRLKVVLGDKIVLQTFQAPETAGLGAVAPTMSQFIVGGIFETGMYEYDANLVYIGIKEAQKLMNYGNSVSGIQGLVKDPWKIEEIRDEIGDSLRYPYYVSDWKSKNMNLLKWINIEKIMITFVLALIILVAAFNIISSLIMAVLNKTREIGILRSMGVSSVGIMRIFIYMGSFIGLAGSFLGVGSGLALCYVQLNWHLIKLPPDVYSIPYFPIKVMWVDVLSVFIISNILCILATIIPARQASKLDPVGAIRND